MARLAMKPSLKGRALRLLSQREHSRKELEQKLKPHEETPGELAEALDFLAAKDFINEKRVVESVDGVASKEVKEPKEAKEPKETKAARQAREALEAEA